MVRAPNAVYGDARSSDPDISGRKIWQRLPIMPGLSGSTFRVPG